MQRALQCFTNARAKFEARKPGGGEGAPYYRQIAEAEAAKEREEAQQRMAWCVGLLVGILILGGLIWGGWYAFILHGNSSTEVAEPEVGAGARRCGAGQREERGRGPGGPPGRRRRVSYQRAPCALPMCAVVRGF